MDHIGIDVHKRESQICILAEGGELIERRIRTEPERFAAVLGDRPRARIVIEASTDSEWVARCLESLEHEVVVADPNFSPMYATRPRKVKTDRRDARALADACVLAPTAGRIASPIPSGTCAGASWSAMHSSSPARGTFRSSGRSGVSTATGALRQHRGLRDSGPRARRAGPSAVADRSAPRRLPSPYFNARRMRLIELAARPIVSIYPLEAA